MQPPISCGLMLACTGPSNTGLDNCAQNGLMHLSDTCASCIPAWLQVGTVKLSMPGMTKLKQDTKAAKKTKAKAAAAKK